MSSQWPTELAFKKSDRVLAISFDDGEAYTIPYKRLREESPSAENKGHGMVRHRRNHLCRTIFR